jgi:hypothetical protein
MSLELRSLLNQSESWHLTMIVGNFSLWSVLSIRKEL